MPYKQTDFLRKLIKGLSPAEKRHFRMFVNKNGNNTDALFIQLFDFLDKAKIYDEEKLFKKIPTLKPSQLSNVKSNLYRQLLTSLRQQQRNDNQEIAIRENIDYAVILYNKGLYKAALDILDKAKKVALENKKSDLVLSILQFEKRIESLYITGSMYPKAKQLREQTKEVLKELTINNELSNLSISIYGLYLQYGFVRNAKDFNFINEYFKSHLPSTNERLLDFYGKLYLYQCHVWYYFMIQDFSMYYKYSLKWVELFTIDKKLKERELTLFIKGQHNYLNALFMAQLVPKFEMAYSNFISIENDFGKTMNQDQFNTFQLIQLNHGINRFFLNGEYEKGVSYIDQHSDYLFDNILDWDINRVLVIYFKTGCLYFGNGDYGKALDCLNNITNRVIPGFREDIQCFARILELIIHYELKNQSVVNSQILSSYRYLSKIEHLQSALKEILSTLKRLSRISPDQVKSCFIKLRDNLKNIEGQDFERRPFLYLDIISWLDCKIENRPFQEIIKRKINSNR